MLVGMSIDMDKLVVYTAILATISFDLVVSEIKFLYHPTERQVRQDNPVTFQCGARATVTPNITWLIDGKELNITNPNIHVTAAPGDFHIFSSLRILSVQRADVGAYQCKAWSNDEELLSNAAHLTVFGRPVFTLNPTNQNVSKNTPFSLSCNAEGPSYPVTITWYQNGVPIADLPHHELRQAQPDNPAILKIRGITLGSTFMCVATNDDGTTYSSPAVVNIKEKPKKPLNITVLSTTPHTVNISWILGSDGYSPYQFCSLQYVKDVDYNNGSPDYWLNAESNTLTEHVLGDLNAVTVYWVRVSCTNEIGQSLWSDTISVQTLMGVPSAAPQIIDVTLVDNSTIGIEWEPIRSQDVNGILSGYKVEYINMENNEQAILQRDPNITSAEILFIDQSVNYTVQIWGYTQGGDGVKTEPIIVGYEVLKEDKVVLPPTVYPPVTDELGVSTPQNGRVKWYIIFVAVIGALIIVCVFTVTGCALYTRRYNKRHEANMEAGMINKRYSFINPLAWKPIRSRAHTIYKPSKNKVVTNVLKSLDMGDEINSKLKDTTLPTQWLYLGVTIGEGEFGVVRQGKLTYPDGREQKVAVKTMKTAPTKDELLAFIKEGVVMKEFDHPNVMSLTGICLEEDLSAESPCVKPMVILPYMENGDVHSYLLNNRLSGTPQYLPVHQLVSFMVQIAEGMAYLSAKDYVHRDLAARNCMLDENLVVKIADFGLTRKLYNESNYYRMGRVARVPVKWMALESLGENIYTTQTDVWSFGVVMWEIFTRGKTPYRGIHNHDIHEFLQRGRRLKQPKQCPDELNDIMLSCWLVDPKERPTFSSLAIKLEEICAKLETNPDEVFYVNTVDQESVHLARQMSSDTNYSMKIESSSDDEEATELEPLKPNEDTATPREKDIVQHPHPKHKSSSVNSYTEC